MEYKTITAEQLVEADDRTIAGFAAVTGNIDTGGDRIYRGAFKHTIKNPVLVGRVKHLWQHDFTAPPTAKIVSLTEVGVDDLPDQVKKNYPDANGGLLVVRKYLDTPRADEILTGIKSGAIAEMSFGYDPVKWDYEELKSDDANLNLTAMVRNLREVRVWDTSDVNWGMNEATVASKLAPLLEAYKEQLQPDQYALISKLVSLAEQSTKPDQLAKAGRVLSSRNLDRLKNALDVLTEILLAAEPTDEEDEKTRSLLTEQALLRIRMAKHNLVGV